MRITYKNIEYLRYYSKIVHMSLQFINISVTCNGQAIQVGHLAMRKLSEKKKTLFHFASEHLLPNSISLLQKRRKLASFSHLASFQPNNSHFLALSNSSFLLGFFFHTIKKKKIPKPKP